MTGRQLQLLPSPPRITSAANPRGLVEGGGIPEDPDYKYKYIEHTTMKVMYLITGAHMSVLRGCAGSASARRTPTIQPISSNCCQ